MKIQGSVALVTGALGGIGQAFVTKLLELGVNKVYLTGRDAESLSVNLKDADSRVVPLVLDVTNQEQIDRAADTALDVTLLINNAGYAAFEGAISAEDLGAARREMDINYFGALALSRAFQPVLGHNGGGAIVNMLSMAALVSLPVTGTYSASKAALLSATRSIRAEMAAQGTIVVGVLAVQTETAIGARLPEPRMQPIEVATDALQAVEDGVNAEITAGQMTRMAYETFLADPKAFQARMSTRLPKAR